LAPHNWLKNTSPEDKNTLSPGSCQIISFGYNDTAHFLKKEYKRNYYFKKVKEIWTASRKHSKMRGNLQNMFLTLKKETSCYDCPVSIVLRAEKRRG